MVCLRIHITCQIHLNLKTAPTNTQKHDNRERVCMYSPSPSPPPPPPPQITPPALPHLLLLNDIHTLLWNGKYQLKQICVVGGGGMSRNYSILKAIKLLNGVSLAGRCWPAYSGIWILSPLKKILSVLQSWTPSDKTFWILAWKESIYR